MFELPHTQIVVECLPQPIQFVAQGIDHGIGRLAQPGNVEVLQRFGLALQFHQFVAEAAVPDTVVEVNLAGGQTFAELPIDPEFIAIPAKAGRLAGFVGIEEMGSQSFRYGVFRDLGDRALREALLTGEDILHPGQCHLPRAAGRLS